MVWLVLSDLPNRMFITWWPTMSKDRITWHEIYQRMSFKVVVRFRERFWFEFGVARSVIIIKSSRETRHIVKSRRWLISLSLPSYLRNRGLGGTKWRYWPEWRSNTLYHWYVVGTWRKEERRDSPGDGVQSLRHDQLVKVLKLAAVSQVSTAQQLHWYWASNTTPQH
jgi:hypothetical protein